MNRRTRRTPEDIAAEQQLKEARRREREERAAARKAEWDAAYPQRAAQYQIEHDQRLAHEANRERLRKIQEAGIAYIMGYDTPAARWVAKFVRSNEEFLKAQARKRAAAGDPLNITGHTPKPNKKQKKKQAEAERLQRGERTIVLTDPDSPNQDVLVSTMPHSFRRIKQLKIHHEPAAERFVRDWETAGYSGLASPGFDPRVDTSPKAHAGHLRATEAQKRLTMVEREIGARNYDICKAVLLRNANPSLIHQLGGRDHRSVSHDIEVALNALAGFYDPERLARDPTWRAFKMVLESGNAVIRQGEEETR